MDLSTAIGLFRPSQRALNAESVSPAALGPLPDLMLERAVLITPVDLSVDFFGPSLVFALAPGSAPLPSGLALSTGGVSYQGPRPSMWTRSRSH